MATKRDYYEVLGVSKDADATAIKSAYKKQAIKYHPDKNPGDKAAEEKFKEAAEAYGVLSDEQKKAQYDRFGHAGMNAMGGGGGGAGPQGFSNFEDIFSAFGDIFGGGEAFGGAGRRGGRPSGPPRGQDIQIALTLTLKEVAKGVTKKIQLKRYNACKTCKGEGGTGKQTCSGCNGQGQVRRVQNSFFGQVVNVTTCPQCGGTGQQVKTKCPDCGGQGRIMDEALVQVDIPAGVEEGQYLTLRGEGHRGPQGGASGDLMVVIHEAKDDFFERRGADLHCAMDVSFTTLALGGAVRVPTLEGEVELKIPAGTESEKLMRLRDKGLPELHGKNHGHLYVKLHAHTPQALSGRETELLKELQKIWETKPNSNPQGLKDKAKSFFS